MEYLDGETVAARLHKGPLPIDQVLRYAIEIASALATAVAGRAVPLTSAGTILGTFNYMKPEQLAGKETDVRSDLFAFGAVVYEMATGRRAFEGASPASVIAAILDRDPEPLSRLQPLAPPAFEHLVVRCLQKDPEDRWQTARDLLAHLEWVVSGYFAPSGTATERCCEGESRNHPETWPQPRLLPRSEPSCTSLQLISSALRNVRAQTPRGDAWAHRQKHAHRDNRF